ncbi:MAG: HxlR family transcriptional regulator [Propionibacteriaceae bacterium]|jgi:DNA-binding HxlR family transcriptional regulator|nr:HxlR family transcriptional regulator [Propionibacteriaceae bacterium]
MVEESPDDYALGTRARLGLNVIAHKWTLMIALALKAGPLRFSALRRSITGVTAQVLTESLRQMERDGIVERHEAAEPTPRVEYCLTSLGLSLCTPAQAIRAWAEENGPRVEEARRRYDDRVNAAGSSVQEHEHDRTEGHR